eukprot:11509-Heterococcus_DN1.PRE.2
MHTAILPSSQHAAAVRQPGCTRQWRACHLPLFTDRTPFTTSRIMSAALSQHVPLLHPGIKHCKGAIAGAA